MREVINLQGKIAGRGIIDRGMTVGYGAAHRVTGNGWIASVAVDSSGGPRRAPGNRVVPRPGVILLPGTGRVSMDITTFDVTGASGNASQSGSSCAAAAPTDHGPIIYRTKFRSIQTREGGSLTR